MWYHTVLLGGNGLKLKNGSLDTLQIHQLSTANFKDIIKKQAQIKFIYIY